MEQGQGTPQETQVAWTVHQVGEGEQSWTSSGWSRQGLTLRFLRLDRNSLWVFWVFHGPRGHFKHGTPIYNLEPCQSMFRTRKQSSLSPGHPLD